MEFEEQKELVKDYLEDYPEAEPAIKAIAQSLIKAQFKDLDPGKLNETLSSLKNEVSQVNFEKAVITGFRDQSGNWVEGHPDAYKVMGTKDFETWFKSREKLNPTVGSISDPARAIELLNDYKAEKARAASSAHDRDSETRAAEVRDVAGAPPEKGTEVLERKRKKDEDKSPEELFQEGVKEG